MLLRGLRKREADDSARDAIAVLLWADDCTACGGAVLVVLLGGGEPCGHQIDQANRVPDPADIGGVVHRLEMRAALFETRPREIEISEPEVNLADALQRVRLQYPFVPRLPFLSTNA